jgi:hypothetical protein
MEIQALKVFISEQELQELALQNQPPEAPVKNITVRVTPEGVRVAGEFPTMMMNMSFESVWKPDVADGKVTVHLTHLTAAGFPATMLRPLVLGALKDAIKEPFIQILDESVVVDVQEFVRKQKLPVGLTFAVQSVRCVEGGVVAEAGLPAPITKSPIKPPI